METTLFILELIGTVAFSISGTIAAMRKNMDLLGISMMAIITAVGGGYIRDITLGLTPPTAFIKSIYIMTALASCYIFILFFMWYQKDILLQQRLKSKNLENLMNLSDSLGLGVFTVSGATVALYQGYENNLILLLFVSTITGVGGGILRDVFTMNIPMVFTKHIYAIASMCGLLIYLISKIILPNELAMMLGVISVVFIRTISAKYRLSLPKIKI